MLSSLLCVAQFKTMEVCVFLDLHKKGSCTSITSQTKETMWQYMIQRQTKSNRMRHTGRRDGLWCGRKNKNSVSDANMPVAFHANVVGINARVDGKDVMILQVHSDTNTGEGKCFYGPGCYKCKASRNCWLCSFLLTVLFNNLPQNQQFKIVSFLALSCQKSGSRHGVGGVSAQSN